MATVKYQELAEAFDFVNFGGSTDEKNAYLSLDTGAIYYVSDLYTDDGEVPDDLETSDRYVEIPHKYDLNLGNDLALRFAARELPHRYNRIEDFFHHRGAYARFKELLAAENCLEKWYAFEAESTEQALRAWCADNGIQVVDNERGSAA